MNTEKLKEYAPIAVRLGMCFVYLWFGISQLVDPTSFFGYLPPEIVSLTQSMHISLPFVPNSTYLFIYLNGMLEVILGTLLAIGLFTRISSLILGVHLFFIMLSLGYNEIAVRDFGLAMATISVFLNGPDKLSLDKKLMPRLKEIPVLNLAYLFDRD